MNNRRQRKLVYKEAGRNGAGPQTFISCVRVRFLFVQFQLSLFNTYFLCPPAGRRAYHRADASFVAHKNMTIQARYLYSHIFNISLLSGIQ